ncbi:hypothetical protein [Nonomuraea longicatena]|uniref:hypothetical protein n=1 Tax=Nonomuraea longicatena TaxID=83682 RepID=UPI0031D21411
MIVRLVLSDLAVWARARQIIAVSALCGRTADATARTWATCPSNWCERRGCPTCWNRGCPL